MEYNEYPFFSQLFYTSSLDYKTYPPTPLEEVLSVISQLTHNTTGIVHITGVDPKNYDHRTLGLYPFGP